MSHKAGHIVIESIAPPASMSVAAEVVGATRVELSFPAGMSIDERIAKVREVMRVIDRLEHGESPD